ncbi:unnamed protein product [Cunninghamella blakesleeana]
MVKVNSYANGKLFSKETVTQWELKRLEQVSKWFEVKAEENKHILRNNLTEIKLAIGDNELRNKLKFYLMISSFISSIVSFLSFGKRAFSIVEIVIEDTELKPKEFINKLNLILMDNSIKYNKMKLMACPDHYLILTTGETTQEVIETTGGSPFPSQFFITYGDGEGLQSKKDPDYDEQIFGVARTKGGTVIGGVRHQVKKEANGLRVKLLVEFPSLVRPEMIKEHQMHLMCEFNNWINDILQM